MNSLFRGAVSAGHNESSDKKPPAPGGELALPRAHQNAVEECRDALRLHAPQPAPGKAQHRYSAGQLKFLASVKHIENKDDAPLYTPSRYNEQLARAGEYADAFVDGWKGALPQGGKPALKEKFHAIIEGAAGMETGWSTELVRGSAERPHTGVFQEAWPFVHEANAVFSGNASLKGELEKHADDAAVLNLSKSSVSRGLPATSFAGQGAAFAAMAARSYENLLLKKGSPDDFSGAFVYEDHLLGPGGANHFRDELAVLPDARGHPGIGKDAYNQNFLVIAHPRAPVNDLNPARTMFEEASPSAVRQMLHDKFVQARNKMAALGVGDERVLAFEKAFLPDWRDGNKKADDIARVLQQQEAGKVMRAAPEAVSDPCIVLQPMTFAPQKPKGQANER